jgi:hypothetical protein
MRTGPRKFGTKSKQSHEFERLDVRLEFHDDFDADTIELDTDKEISGELVAAMRADIERHVEAEFFGFSVQGRNEYFDGQYRIKLVD